MFITFKYASNAWNIIREWVWISFFMKAKVEQQPTK